MITSWILFDRHKIGSRNQCIGLARALKIDPIIYPIHVNKFWKIIPRTLWPDRLVRNSRAGDFSVEKLPQLVIASGWLSAGIAAILKRRYQVKVIYILNPKMPLKNFDWVVAPAHDRLSGENVISVLGSLHPHQFDLPTTHQRHWHEQWQHLTGMKVALLIGGNNKDYRLDQTIIDNLGRHLNALHDHSPISLIITFSRRTSPLQRQLICKNVQGIPHWIWDDVPPNPYIDMIQQADVILITADSVSMVSEACASGKPVYIIRLTGQSKKFDLFYQQLLNHNHARLFQGSIDNFGPILLDETNRVQKILRPWLSDIE